MSDNTYTATPTRLIPRDEVVSQAEAFKADTDHWMDDNAHYFDPMQWTDIEKREIRRKAFTEASHYLYVAEEHGDVSTPRLKDLLTTRANDESFYHLLMRNPTEITKYGYPLVYLSTIDELEQDARRALDDVLEWPETWSKSQLPSRQLDLWHLCRMYGYDDHDIDFQQLLNQGYVSRYLNPARAEQNEAYGLTHEILYYHNLGSRSDRFPTEPLTHEFPSVLPGLILRFLVEGHADLVAELLLCGVLQRQVPPGLVRFTLSWLLDHVHEEGYLSFPSDNPDELKKYVGRDLENWEDEGRTWRCYYHPTVVGGLLARTLSNVWPKLCDETDRRDLDYRRQGKNLVKLGQVFAAFADYSLEKGATYVEELAETPIVEEYDDTVRHAVRFLETQRRPDGTFGYWSDEKRMYTSESDANTETRFRENLLKPVSEQCESAIDAVQANIDSSDTVR